MHYISEFTRSKPIAVCVELKLPQSKLPLTSSQATASRGPKNWQRNWRTQMANALKTIDVEKRNSAQAYYHELLDDLAQALQDIYRYIYSRGTNTTVGTEAPGEEYQVLIRDLRTAGRYADACHCLDLMLDELALEQGNDSPQLAGSYLQLADMLLASGLYAEAEHNARIAQDIYVSNLGAQDQHVLQCELILAETALHREKLDLVLEAAGNVLARSDSSLAPLTEARALHLLALTEGIQRQFPRALENAQNASRLIADSPGDDLSLPAKYTAFEGILYHKLAKWDEAEACFDQAATQLQTLLPDQHIDIGRITLEAGRFYMLKEDFSRAERLLEQAQGIFAKLDAHARLERLITATLMARLSRLRDKPQLTKRMVRRGLKACAKLKIPNPEWQFRLEVEEAHLTLRDGKHEDAVTRITALLDCREQWAGPSQRSELYLLLGQAQRELQDPHAAKSSLQQALQALPKPILIAEDRHLQACVLLALARLWMEQPEPAKALQAVQTAQGSLDLHPFEQALLAGCSEYLQGHMALQAADYARAQPHFHQALVHLERRDPPHDHLSVTCSLWLGYALLQLGSNEQALAVLQPLAEDKEYKNLSSEADMIRALYFLAMALSAAGCFNAALKCSQRAYKRLGKLQGAPLTHKEQYDLRSLIGNLHLGKGQHQAAIEVLSALLADMTVHLPQPEALAPVEDLLAQAYEHLGDLAAAATHWRQCLAHLRQYHETNSQNVFRIRARLAAVLEQQGKWDLALKENQFLYQNSRVAPESREQLHRQYTIAHLHFRLGHMDQAQPLVEQLLQTPAQLQQAGKAPLDVFLLLSRIYVSLGQPKAAQATLQDALARFGQQGEDLVKARIHSELGTLLEQDGELIPAIACWEHALTAFRTQPDPESIWQCLQQLARLLWRVRRQDESLDYSTEALKLALSHPKLFKKPRVIRLCLDQGQKYASLERVGEALKCYKQGIDLANVKKSRKHVPLASQCLLATAALLPPKEAEEKYQQVQKLYARQKVQPDTVLASCCMKYGLMLWNRNKMTDALREMDAAYAAHQHVVNQATHTDVPHDLIMTVQYQVLLHADLGHWDQAAKLLQDRLRLLPKQAMPKNLTQATVGDQLDLVNLMRSCSQP